MGDEKINDDYIQRQENLWIIHCENFLRKGKIPKRWEELPQYIKTERMRKYYVELKKRLEP
ncbi:hypothetical protein [Leptospira adleri]|uniref:Uncharacterized protein n=1 Tax=Leptospira adleri TaxID=2023186 RepID=A0A2M9YJ63_9LEPT|nr:hypothetical protein [Leptospira adleri]PJZ51585.1 hypothetical protein CH380_19255 [Leptospira adleri]PJZ61906.1 hypothetical protein CH376_10910 [Leptospira adleri]